MMRSVAVAAFLTLLGTSFIAPVHAEEPKKEEPKKKLDLRASELYLMGLDGVATKLGPHAGKRLTLVNLWATWCGPCREELPALDRLHKKHAAQGFAVVGIDVDETGPVVKRFLGKHAVSYPMLLSTPNKTVPALGDLEALPTTLVLDETGDVLEVLVGGIEVPYLTKLIETRLGPAPVEKPSKPSKPVKAAAKKK